MARDDNAPLDFVPLDETPPSGIKPLDETPPSGTPAPIGGAPAGFQPPPSSGAAPAGFQPTQPGAAGKPPTMPRPGEVKFSCPCGKHILAPPGVVVMCPKCRKIQRAPGKLQAPGRAPAPPGSRPTAPAIKRDRSGLIVGLVGVLAVAGVVAFLGYKITNDIAKRKGVPSAGGQLASQPANGKETIGATIARLKAKADELRTAKKFVEAKAAYVAALTAMNLLAEKNHPLRKVIIDALESDDIKYGTDPAGTHVLFGGQWITRAQYEAIRAKGIKPAAAPQTAAASQPKATTAAPPQPATQPKPAAAPKPKPKPAAPTIMPLKPTEANLLLHGRIIATDNGPFTPHNVQPGTITKFQICLKPHFENWARAPGSTVKDAKGLGKLNLDLDQIKLSTPEGMAGSFTRADKNAAETTLDSPFILNLAVSKRCEPRTYALDFKVPVQTDPNSSAKVSIEVSFSVVVEGEAPEGAPDAQPETAAPAQPSKQRPLVRRLIIPGLRHH